MRVEHRCERGRLLLLVPRSSSEKNGRVFWVSEKFMAISDMIFYDAMPLVEEILLL